MWMTNSCDPFFNNFVRPAIFSSGTVLLISSKDGNRLVKKWIQFSQKLCLLTLFLVVIEWEIGYDEVSVLFDAEFVPLRHFAWIHDCLSVAWEKMKHDCQWWSAFRREWGKLCLDWKIFVDKQIAYWEYVCLEGGTAPFHFLTIYFML